jgi:hypothetical protein
MRSNLNGVQHKFCLLLIFLSSRFLSTTSVYTSSLCINSLKDRDDPSTPEEIDIASSKKQLDERTEVEYLKKLEKASENIKKAFEDQQARAAVNDSLLSMCASHSLINNDQEKFRQYLTEWIITCDQPFNEVEFITMMNYTHQSGSPLKIPQHNAIK